MCHGCFHCQCSVAAVLLPELGSWNGNKAPKPVDEETFSAELRCQKSRFQLGCCVHWMSLTVGKMRKNYYFEISHGVMIGKNCSSQGNLFRSQQVPLLHSAASHGKKLARAQQVIPIWHAVPGNNNWQVPICVQLLKNYHPAWYYPSALGRLVLWKELLMADFSIPQGCAHAEVSAPRPDFKVNELWVINKKYHSLIYSLFLYFQFLYISISISHSFWSFLCEKTGNLSRDDATVFSIQILNGV